ncbi:MAG TPA: phosphatase PAP2 family protein [Gaiellaceae bacterium]|nr:phosphatase PAP2 family protein [Gaiellaceae bacterium]
MPIFVLLLISLAAGSLFAWASFRYPTPAGKAPPDMAAKTEQVVEQEMERHPWLLRLVRGRLDPATATGLALTLALGLVIVGGLVIGALAYLVRSSDTLADLDRSVGQWGVDNATSWSTHALEVVTELGTSVLFVIPAAIVLAVVEYRRIPNRWIPVFLAIVVLGEILVVNTIKELLDRTRPEFNEIAQTLGPSFPSGHSGLAAAFYAGAALVLARRRSPRTRALLAGGAVAIAVGVACSRVLLGVHWLSDVIGGLALGWAWFAVCAIAFGGRFLVLGAPVEEAAEVAEQHVPAEELPVSSGQTS